MAQLCDKCTTPLDEAGACVTCAAREEGLEIVTRSGFASVREMMSLLEEQGVGAEMEKVPPGRPEERQHPLWNLYVPTDEVQRAVAFLTKDWADLLSDPAAAEAAARGQAGIDVDAGGEVTCPACGHRFAIGEADAECPDCGLALGAPGDASPDEGHE
jgi:uncharacterized Zn finger protein (UPF0148 family)